MLFAVTCPSCGAVTHIDNSALGKTLTCPTCQRVLAVRPAPPPQAVVAAPPAPALPVGVTAARPHPVTPGQGKPGPVAEPTPKGSGRLALLVLLPAGLLAVALVGLAFPALSRGVLLMVGAWCLLGVVAALLVWLGHRHSMVSAGPCVVTVAVFGVLGAAGLVVAVLRGSDDPAHHLEPGPENPWITYQPERRWRVEMPGEPAVQKEDEGEGRIATLHGFKHPATGAAFVVIHYDLDKGKPWLGTPDEALRKARDRVLAQAPRSKEKEARRCPLGEHPGMEFVLDTPGQGPIVLRTYLVRQRVYLLVVGGPGAGPGSRAAQRFLDSFTLLTPPVPTPVPATDFPDLFAYWRFNEAEGDAVADASGNGNPGRLHRPFGRAAGVEGMALQPLLPVEKTPRHEWRAGCMKMGPSPRFNFAAGTAFTYAVWVKTNSDWGRVVSQIGPSGRPAVGLAVEKGKLVAEVGTDRGGARLVGGLINDEVWHHIALVRRKDGRVLLYLDGQRQSSEGVAPGALRAVFGHVGADHVVAQEFNHGFCGLIDELCVFGRDLTEDELGQLAGRLPRQRKDDPRPSGPPEVAPRWTFATGIPFGHDGALAASPDGRLLVAAATQRPARFYDLTEGKPRTDLPAFPAKAPLAFSPDGKYLAGRVFGVPRQVQVLNLPDKTLVPWQGPTEGGGVDIPEGLSFTADGKRIGIAARAPLLLEAADGAALPLTLPQGPVSFLHFGLDGKTVLVAGAGGYRPPRFRCDQVELATGKVVRWFGVDVGGGRDEPPELKATPDLGYLAVRQRDQTTIHVWQLAEEKKLAFPESLPGFAWRAFTWAPDHRTLVLSSTRGDLVLWDVFAEKETGRIRVQTEGAGAGAVACSGDGRWIAAGLRSGEVKVWAVADLRGKPFEPLRLPGPPAGR